MDTLASAKQTPSHDHALPPTLDNQRRTGVAFSCVLGAFCGLYLDHVVKNGATMGPTPAIFYWLLFVIASGFFIERGAFNGGWLSKERLMLLWPPIAIIATFIAPPLLMTIASGKFSVMWTLALAGFSLVILLATPVAILVASDAKPVLQQIATTIITTDESKISDLGKRVAAAWQVLGIVMGVVQGGILFFSK
ncbi:hypothetical protein [Methylocystis bryophila]|uniref:Uncharacterized protein n=1 Tax=Methylocystis bryophila TaxID=655015 RepID=A0A1W6MYJ5_9HYPH|nr:hypothetical protein [Methylocystis bryophila]ARN82654.1 hypothetical protein B1812_17875 [Methylocystis bryophila]BDV38867.1 hypothetical protein DSM21852_21200 [Methylocystis bryophila]